MHMDASFSHGGRWSAGTFLCHKNLKLYEKSLIKPTSNLLLSSFWQSSLLSSSLLLIYLKLTIKTNLKLFNLHTIVR